MQCHISCINLKFSEAGAPPAPGHRPSVRHALPRLGVDRSVGIRCPRMASCRVVLRGWCTGNQQPDHIRCSAGKDSRVKNAPQFIPAYKHRERVCDASNGPWDLVVLRKFFYIRIRDSYRRLRQSALSLRSLRRFQSMSSRSRHF